MMYVTLTIMLTLLGITLLTIDKFSYEILRVKNGKERVMHNVCYTDNVDVSQTHGNVEPHQ